MERTFYLSNYSYFSSLSSLKNLSLILSEISSGKFCCHLFLKPKLKKFVLLSFLYVRLSLNPYNFSFLLRLEKFVELIEFSNFLLFIGSFLPVNSSINVSIFQNSSYAFSSRSSYLMNKVLNSKLFFHDL